MKRFNLKRELRSQDASDKEIAELMTIADQLNHTELPKLSSAVRQRIEEQTIRPSKAPLIAKWSLAGSFAAFIAIVIGAQFSLPGSPLYAIKRTTNDIHAFFQPSYKEQLIEARKDELQKVEERPTKQITETQISDEFIKRSNEKTLPLDNSKRGSDKDRSENHQSDEDNRQSLRERLRNNWRDSRARQHVEEKDRHFPQWNSNRFDR